MSLRDAARANWRADLQEYTAEAMRSAGLTDLADEQDREAASKREYAALMTELADAKAAGDKTVLDGVKRRVIAFRHAMRTSAGSRPITLDNFSEPSDSELIAQGY